ncbi:MAG: tetratricopeptide repeat protein [Acidobacteria bacterium]|nr:tetratricopeptide repeat protein [Acidobacteriota bacterium]
MKVISTKRFPFRETADLQVRVSLRSRWSWSAICLVGLTIGTVPWASARNLALAISPQETPSEELSPTQVLENRADLYMVRKYYPEAVEVYKRLLRMEPKNALYHNKLGIAYHQMQDFNSAKKAYRDALQWNPNYAQAINNLAAVEYSQKNFRSAILNYIKALQLSPNDAVIYSNLGTAYFAYEKYEYAITSYRYALLLDPNIFQGGGRTGSIVQQRDEKNVGAFNFYMAKVYAEMGKAEETLRHLEKAWEEGFPDILQSLQDKVFAFLAEDPRFLELVSRIQAAEQQKAQSS